MPNTIITNAKERMSKAIQTFSRELASIRAGRANASLLDKISVDYYGAPTPVNQLAGISIPEARMLVIQPYDKPALVDCHGWNGNQNASFSIRNSNHPQEIG